MMGKFSTKKNYDCNKKIQLFIWMTKNDSKLMNQSESSNSIS